MVCFLSGWPLGRWLRCCLGLLMLGATSASVLAADQVSEVDFGQSLELAAQACEAGDNAGLEKASGEIRQLLAALPSLDVAWRQYVEQWLLLFQYGVCRPEQIQRNKLSMDGQHVPAAESNGAASFSVAVGYLDNVNLGTRHERLSINNPFGNGKIELEVDESSRPLSSSFVNIRGGYQVLNTHGGLDYVAAQKQFYPDVPKNNITGFAAGRQWLSAQEGREAQIAFVGDGRGNARGSIGGRYQKILGAQALKVLEAGLRYDIYPEQKGLEALLTDLSIKQQYPLQARGKLLTDITLTYDHALGERPGGGRAELELSGNWEGEAIAGWQPSLGATLAYKRDFDPYNQVLFGDSVRNQVRTGLDIGLAKKISKNKRLLLQYNMDRIQDSEIPLFDLPVGNTVSLAIEGNLSK